MPFPKPYYAFVSGEVSPAFFGRSDLTKYDLGVEDAKNFFVDYRGGLSSRPGTELIAPVKQSEGTPTLVRFQATTADYVLVFADEKLRFVREGGYVLESAKTVTGITTAEPPVVTATGHGYATGDIVYISGIGGMTQINGRYYLITVLGANTFSLQDLNAADIDASAYTPYNSSGVVSRVYTVTTPYSSVNLSTLNFEQKLNDLIITSTEYDRRKLTFVADTNWTLNTITIGATAASPGLPLITPSGAGTAGVAFCVTAVVDGEESLQSPIALTETSVNYTTTAGSMAVAWPAVTGADYYNVYRTAVLPTGTDINKGESFGFVGKTFGNRFVDNNIIPDKTKSPPVFYNPFADGAVSNIEITSGGSAYAKSDAVSVSGSGGTGSGFLGFPVIHNGAVLAVVIVDGGRGYVEPITVSFATSTGSGAAATAEASTIGGNYPRLYKVFQQRGVYAGTDNHPITLWGSVPGEPNNFNVSEQLSAGDSYSYDLDVVSIKPIRHLATLRSGLLIFTENVITLLRAETGKAVSAINALAETQAYKGISDVQPVNINLDVLFVEQGGTAINAMQYTEYTETFDLQDVSILSNHLLGDGKMPLRMVFLESPYKQILIPREDGRMLSLTYERSQEVFGWTQYTTQGLYKDALVVQEREVSKLYLVVERYVGGVWRQFIERQASREHTLDEDFWCVDCGLEYPLSSPDAQLTFSAATGAATITADASVFALSNVGDIIYAGGGKLQIYDYVSGTEVTGTWLRDMSAILPECYPPVPERVASGDWQIATPTTTVTGLWHLEGQTVSILADGDAFLNETVSNGTITLDNAATKIKVGLAYCCRGKTLPATTTQAIIEGKRKKILGAAVRRKDTRGLKFGPDYDNLIEMREREDQDWGESLGLYSDSTYVHINHGWDEEGQMCFEQDYPLPATVLGLVLDIEAED